MGFLEEVTHGRALGHISNMTPLSGPVPALLPCSPLFLALMEVSSIAAPLDR